MTKKSDFGVALLSKLIKQCKTKKLMQSILIGVPIYYWCFIKAPSKHLREFVECFNLIYAHLRVQYHDIALHTQVYEFFDL